MKMLMISKRLLIESLPFRRKMATFKVKTKNRDDSFDVPESKIISQLAELKSRLNKYAFTIHSNVYPGRNLVFIGMSGNAGLLGRYEDDMETRFIPVASITSITIQSK